MIKEPISTPVVSPESLFRRAIVINFLLLLLVLIVSFTLAKDEANTVIVSAVTIQTAFNFFIGLILVFIPRSMKIGQSMMLSAVVVLLAGLLLYLLRSGF